MQKNSKISEIHAQANVLHYHLGLLRAQKSYKLYCNVLRLKIIPLIRATHRNFVNEWASLKTSYLLESDKLRKKIILEIKLIYEILKQRLFNEGLLGHLEIKKSTESLDAALDFKPEVYFVDNIYDIKKKILRGLKKDELSRREGEFVSPAQYIVAFDRLKNLCHSIVALKRQDLVEGYVETFLYIKEYFEDPNGSKIYQCNECFKLFKADSLQIHDIDLNGDLHLVCPKCNDVLQKISSNILREIPYIEHFSESTFVPSFFELIELETDFWASAAGSWEMLYYIDWGWDIANRDYFRKDLSYDSPDACARTMELLNLNHMRLEIRALKDGREKNIYILNRDRIDKCLNVVTKELYKNIATEKLLNFCGPEKIKVDMIGFDLRLIVKWSTGLVEEYNMHSFHEREKNKQRYVFFCALINSKGLFVPLNEDSGDAKKYLREAGFDKIFDNLFIVDSNKQGAIFRDKEVILDSHHGQKLEKIRKYFQKFTSLGWRSNF